MKVYTQADDPKDDSLEFKFLHFDWCSLSADGSLLQVVYWRDNFKVPVSDNLLIEDLVKAYPILVDALLDITSSTNLKSAERGHTIVATAAFLFDSYIDLKPAVAHAKYPYLTGNYSIKSASIPGLFTLHGTFFNTQPGNLIPSICSSSTTTVKNEIIETLWPNSTTTIPVLESLGYSEHAVANMIITGCSGFDTIAAPTVPDLE